MSSNTSDSQNSTLPHGPSEITPEWLDAALAPRHPGVAVAAVDVLAERGSTNHHAKLGLRYDHRAGAPDTLFCKMAPLDPAHRAQIGATGMGMREARFYNEVAHALTMRVPGCSFAGSDDDGGFLLLLEDLSVSGCRMSDGTWGVAADLAAGALADLAQMHVHYEDPARLDALRPWVMANPAGATDFTSRMLRMVIDEQPEKMSPAYIEVGEMYIGDPARVVGLWHEGEPTLIHGDTHIGNVFIDGDRVGFLDWGLLTVMPPMRDVSYFITMAMLAPERRASERDLIRHYLDVRASLGGSPIDLDDAWRQHRLQAGYTVLASFLSLVPPYNGEDQREFSDLFRGRAIDALDDLGTVEVMRAALA